MHTGSTWTSGMTMGMTHHWAGALTASSHYLSSHHIIYRWRQKPDTIISSIVHILISLVIIFDISKVFDPIPVKKEVCYLFSLPINFLNHQS